MSREEGVERGADFFIWLKLSLIGKGLRVTMNCRLLQRVLIVFLEETGIADRL